MNREHDDDINATIAALRRTMRTMIFSKMRRTKKACSRQVWRC